MSGTRTSCPRFTVEEVRILLAALHIYKQGHTDPDVRDLYEKVDRLSETLEAKRG